MLDYFVKVIALWFSGWLYSTIWNLIWYCIPYYSQEYY